MSKTNDELQLEQLAQVNNDLRVAESILDEVHQASIWQFNSLGVSDSFIEKTRHASLIERLEAASAEADKLRDTATRLVETLRDEKRKLTKSIGSGPITGEAFSLFVAEHSQFAGWSEMRNKGVRGIRKADAEFVVKKHDSLK